MKMQHEIVAPVDGAIAAIHVEAGAQVASDDLLVEISNASREFS